MTKYNMENENKTPLIFTEGIAFFKPRENAPKSIKGNIVIEIPKLLEFAEKHNVKGSLRVDLRKSETKGTYYLTLNTWKPTPKVEVVEDHTAIDPVTGEDLADRTEIPF